jgi:hypothetical protein
LFGSPATAAGTGPSAFAATTVASDASDARIASRRVIGDARDAAAAAGAAAARSAEEAETTIEADRDRIFDANVMSDREDAATEVVFVVLARAGAARSTRAVEALTASVSDMLLCKIRAWGVRRACDARSGCTG